MKLKKYAYQLIYNSVLGDKTTETEDMYTYAKSKREAQKWVDDYVNFTYGGYWVTATRVREV